VNSPLIGLVKETTIYFVFEILNPGGTMSILSRKTFLIAIAVVILGVGMAGCTLPLQDQPKAPATVSEAATTTLQNLPILKITLPKSLSTTSSTTKSLAGRAIGDTTNLTSVPSMKSQAWYDLQSQGSNSFMGLINKAFDFLRNYAKNNAIQADKVFSIPMTSTDLETAFGQPAGSATGIAVTDQFFISGADSSNFSIYMRATMTISTSNPAMTFDLRTRFDITGSGTSQKISMYFLISLQDGSTTTVI
jgi:hypothetical protein